MHAALRSRRTPSWCNHPPGTATHQALPPGTATHQALPTHATGTNSARHHAARPCPSAAPEPAPHPASCDCHNQILPKVRANTGIGTRHSVRACAAPGHRRLTFPADSASIPWPLESPPAPRHSCHRMHHTITETEQDAVVDPVRVRVKRPLALDARISRTPTPRRRIPGHENPCKHRKLLQASRRN